VTRRILDLFFGRSLQRETSRYLEEVASAPLRASRNNSSRMLSALASGNNRTVTLGMTAWGQQVIIPHPELLNAHGLVTGGSGCGKTRFALLIVKALLAELRQNHSPGLGLIDPKGELFYGVLYLLSRLFIDLDQIDPAAAIALRQRVVIIDFSDDQIVSPYNLIHRCHTVDPEFFADSRTDQFLDLLPARDTVSMNASALLRRAILLLSELSLSITSLPSLLCDESFRGSLLRRCVAVERRTDFERQFASTPKQTVAALTRRIEALLSSRSVRLALDGTAAPDFRALQDAGQIVLINTFGANLSRSVRQLLQAVVVGDVSQAVFARRRKESPFLWILDEAQNCFLTERLRDQMSDVLTQARSFGSFFLFVTQNISTAVHDSRLLSQLHTNIKWSFSMRGQPADCSFLKAALPVTARKLKPQTNPFEPPGAYTINEERAMELDSIANLPDRIGFLWLRSRSPEAIKMTTQSIDIPHGDALENAVRPLLSNPDFGNRVPRAACEAQLKHRDDTSPEPVPSNLSNALASAYARARGKDA
jgi:hypothetical protein